MLYHTHCLVSIPKRVSEALKQFDDLTDDDYEDVSIPKRVSEALKLLGYQGDTQIIGFNP